jgi:hypothetical protein
MSLMSDRRRVSRSNGSSLNNFEVDAVQIKNLFPGEKYPDVLDRLDPTSAIDHSTMLR